MRILFIGNSYTYYNRMPEMVALLSASGGSGKQLSCESVTKGGVTLEWHAQQDDTLNAIRRGGWHTIVLQEQSTRPIRMRDRMLKYAQVLAQEIANVGAQPVLYATWAREHIPEMLDPLALSYAACAELIGAQVAPVGRAFAAVRKQAPEIGLYAPDHSHPSPEGSFLAACVFYAVLTGTNPARLLNTVAFEDGASIGLDVAKAQVLQQVAWAEVSRA